MSIQNNFSDYHDFIIIKLSSLGDIIHTLPSFSALRNHFPQNKITWVVEKNAKQILDLVSGIDRIITYDLKNKSIFSREFWSSLKRLRSSIEKRKSVCLDFQGLIKSGLISYLSKAPTRISFHRRNLKESPASIFYTDHIRPLPETMHVIQKNLELLSSIGIHEKQWDFPINIPSDLILSTLDKLKNKGIKINHNAVIFNVGGAWMTKRWFLDHWINMINLLDFNHFSPIILWGSSEEKKMAEEIKKKTDVWITPFLTVKEVFALIHESKLVVSGDSFPLHAACALSIPVVGLFGPTNPNRNGPFNKRDKIAFHQIKCSYCYKHKCKKLDCLKKIRPDEVARLCKEVLT